MVIATPSSIFLSYLLSSAGYCGSHDIVFLCVLCLYVFYVPYVFYVFFCVSSILNKILALT